ncbi:MAG: hypothetical protein IKX19_04635, partial [Clostridia bacterium]|nr:hypothetical protein [Clostridia bacterium]
MMQSLSVDVFSSVGEGSRTWPGRSANSYRNNIPSCRAISIPEPPEKDEIKAEITSNNKKNKVFASGQA